MLVNENSAVDDESAQECVKEMTACQSDTSAVKAYVIDVQELEVAKHQVVELSKQLATSMKVGADECETLNRELKTLNRKVGDQRHELKKSKKKLDVALGEVQDHLAIKLKLDKELTAAKETETKLKKQIDELLKSVPAVSKPVIHSSVSWYTGCGQAPIVTLVVDDEKERLRRAAEKAAKRGAKELKGLGAEIRKNAHKTVQLIAAEPLTAMQLSQKLLKDSKNICQRPKCVDEAAAVKHLETYVSSITPNVAILYGLLRGVRMFVQIFDKFLNSGQLDHEIIMDFWIKHLCSLARIIRDADPWFSGNNEMFEEFAKDFSKKVKAGVHKRPEFLRTMEVYANSGDNV